MNELEPTKLDCAEAEIESLKAQLDGKWISVEDRLPDSMSNSLAFGGGVIYFIFYSSHGKWCMGNEYLENITHWMPLPNPPTTGK